MNVKGASPSATTAQWNLTRCIQQHNQEEAGGGEGGGPSVDWPSPSTYQVHWHAAKAAGTAWRQHGLASDVPGGVPSDEQRSCAALIPPVSPKTNCHCPHGLLPRLNGLLHQVCRTGGCQGRGVVSGVSRMDNDFKQSGKLIFAWVWQVFRRPYNPLVWLGVFWYCAHGVGSVADELWQAFRVFL